MDKIAFGKFLAELRNEKHLTQEQLAEKLHFGSKTISKWECGEALPNLETLCKICEILDVSLYELTIYKRINNSLITKNDIKKIINKNSIKETIIKKIFLIILIFLIIGGIIFSCIYTITNYNDVKIYELVSEDDNFDIEGFFVEANNKYYLSISTVKYLNQNDKSMQTKINKIQYLINSKYFVDNRNEITFDKKITVIDALSKIRNHTSEKPLKHTINSFDFTIFHLDSNNKNVQKTFKIKLVKKYSNNKLKIRTL